MNPEEEERRRVAAEIARRMVDESAGADDAERFDAGTYADDRALASLARPTAVEQRPPGRPGEAAQAVGEARSSALPFQRNTAPFAPHEQERIQGVEARLQAGDRAGVEADTRREQQGTSAPDEVEDRALSQMARPAVATPTQDPMAAQARGSGSDPGMSLPDPASALRRPQSFQLREQSWADATDAEPWYASGDEPPTPTARLDGAAERDAQIEAMEPPSAEPDGDVDDVALAGLAGAPARPAQASPPALLDPGFAPTKAVAAHEPGEMIPGAADIDRARMEDGFRRPGRALAALFAGIAGRQLRPRESQEDQMRARQRQMTADKQRMRGQDEASARAASQDAQRAQAAEAAQALALRGADRQDEQLELQRQAAARADATAQAQAGVLGERAATARSERERTEARSTPGTDEARRAQTQLQALVNTLPPGASRDRFVEALVGPGMSIDQLSADEVQEVMRRAPEWLRAGLPRASRAGRGGGAGGAAPGSGTPRSAWGTDEDPLVQAAIEANTDPRVARVAAADPSMRRQLARTLSGADVREGRQDEVAEESTRLPGYTREPGARRLSRQESTQALNLTTADAEFNSAIENLERELAQLTPAERVAGGLRQGSERYQVIQHSLDVMRTQFRQINNMGNAIAAQEIVEHQFPDLSQGVTADAILANARAARRVKHAYVAAVLDTLGYTPMGGGHGGGHGGAPRGGASGAPRQAPPAPAGERVAIVLPDGRRASVPESQVEAALARGARRAE